MGPSRFKKNYIEIRRVIPKEATFPILGFTMPALLASQKHRWVDLSAQCPDSIFAFLHPAVSDK